MRSAFDFAPFRRSTVGFDRLFDMLENNQAGNGETVQSRMRYACLVLLSEQQGGR